MLKVNLTWVVLLSGVASAAQNKEEVIIEDLGQQTCSRQDHSTCFIKGQTLVIESKKN